MVIRYRDKALVVLDRAKLIKTESFIDEIITSPSRGAIYQRRGHDGREYAIELPTFLNEQERAYLCGLYRSQGWPSVECEVPVKQKQIFILKL